VLLRFEKKISPVKKHKKNKTNRQKKQKKAAAGSLSFFEHLALRFEKEAVLELDDIEKDLSLPVTPVPKLVLEELKN
jgi:hypothetical protein